MNDQHDSVKKVRQKFWIAFVVLTLVLLLTGNWASCHFTLQNGNSQCDGGTLLGGPGGLTLLAIVVALSAYLRNVASHADEASDGIRETLFTGNINNRERELAYQSKLKRLNNRYEHMHVAAPFMMLLSIALTLRLVFESIVRGGHLSAHGVAFRIADFVILTWMLVAFLTLCALHHFAWREDEKINAMIIHAKQKERHQTVAAAKAE